MISEEQQERAALYALGSLDADEFDAFGHEMAADGELRTLAMELRETAAALAWTETRAAPPSELKARVLAAVSAETHETPLVKGNLVARPSPWTQWLPWAAAAALAILCVILSSEKADADRHLQTALGKLSIPPGAETDSHTDPDHDVFAQVVFCSLEPVPPAQQTGPQAAVLWDAAKRRGKLRITKLPPAGEGKDYQLWTVETGRKDPVSAGVVTIGPDAVAQLEFQPQDDDGKAPVVAFALSRERAGGAPKNEGPILFLGKL